jgi:hypothetical protein
MYLPVAPSRPVNAQFTVGGGATTCMREIGRDQNLTISGAGIACVEIGFVHADDRGTCYVRDNIWALGYTLGDRSGSTLSQWHTPLYTKTDYVNIFDSSPGTHICSEATRCTSTQISFVGTQYLYVRVHDPA